MDAYAPQMRPEPTSVRNVRHEPWSGRGGYATPLIGDPIRHEHAVADAGSPGSGR